jgi:hypothetical protein
MAKQVEETVTIPLPVAEAFQRCQQVADAIPKSKLKRTDDSANTIELRTKVSIKSFGEKVELDLVPEGERATLVRVSSQAVVPTTLVDYGKNQANVNSVVSWLQSIGPGAS